MQNLLKSDRELKKKICVREEFSSLSSSSSLCETSAERIVREIPLLPHLPHDLKVEIALKLSKSSLKSIGGILGAGKEGRDVILNSEFRSRVDLSPFIQNSRLISTNINFFYDCVEDANPQALYLHGLETLCVYGELNSGCSYIERAANLGEKRAVVMYALIFVCSGLPELGVNVLDNGIEDWSTNLRMVSAYAKEIQQTLLQFCNYGHGLFDGTWYCPFPECEFNHETFDCSFCFMYRHSLIIRNLC